MSAKASPSRFVTILTAAEMSTAAGLNNMTQGWWRNCIENETISVVKGVVDYLRREDVEIVIDTVLQARILTVKAPN